MPESVETVHLAAVYLPGSFWLQLSFPAVGGQPRTPAWGPGWDPLYLCVPAELPFCPGVSSLWMVLFHTEWGGGGGGGRGPHSLSELGPSLWGAVKSTSTPILAIPLRKKPWEQDGQRYPHFALIDGCGTWLLIFLFQRKPNQ